MTVRVLKKRSSKRVPVSLSGRCRSSSWSVRNVELSDISADGCCLTTKGDMLEPGKSVIIRQQASEALAGTVCWVAGDCAGIKFDTPLDKPHLDRLVRENIAGRITELRAVD
jgi:PilZ domain